MPAHPAAALRLLGIAAAALCAGWPASAQPAPAEAGAEDAAQAEAEAEAAAREAARLAAEARAAEQEITQLQYALVEAAQARRASEQDALAIDERLAGLTAREAELVARLEDDRGLMVDVVAALVRIERAHPPAMLAHGGRSLRAARAAGVLGRTAPALESRIETALAELAELEAVRTAAARERDELADAEEVVALRREAISALIDERTAELADLRARADARAAEAQELADRARSLRELISELERRAGAYAPRLRPEREAGVPVPRIRPDPADVGDAPPPFTPTTGRFADARGNLALPAEGRIATRFGEPHASGADRGVGIETRRQAQVTSPYDARIEFVGEFRGYGRLVILSVGDGYHVVLAGLSTIYGVAGQTVLAGEPIGEMADLAEPAPDLYVEIRRDGQPIDPAPWWRAGG